MDFLHFLLRQFAWNWISFHLKKRELSILIRSQWSLFENGIFEGQSLRIMILIKKIECTTILRLVIFIYNSPVNWPLKLVILIKNEYLYCDEFEKNQNLLLLLFIISIILVTMWFNCLFQIYNSTSPIPHLQCTVIKIRTQCT